MSRREVIERAASVVGQHQVAKIVIADEDRKAGHLSENTLAEAARLFDEFGYVVIEELFTSAQMKAFEDFINDRAGSRLKETNKEDKRPLFTIPLRGPFLSPEILDNPFIGPLFETMLGDNYILASLSSVVSFPGAPDQYLHRDNTPLFGQENQTDADIPGYAMTMLVPLIDFTHETGCTRVWPGSHKIKGTEQGLGVGSLDPEVRVGSALITDGRLLHRGAANNSQKVRPLFYLQCHRAWYRDFAGYGNRPPLDVSPSVFRSMPDRFKRRVAWSRGAHGARKMIKYRLGNLLPTRLRLRLLKDN